MKKTNLENTVVHLDNQLRYLKTSQTIGQSSSEVYKIVENATMTISSGQYKYGTREIHFTSTGRAFPHFSIIIHSYSVNGGSCTLFPHYLPQYGYKQQADLYRDSYMIYVTTSETNKTVTLNYSVYADTPGICSVV